GRGAIFERAQEVLVELHGLLVAARREPRLCGQDLALDDRVDQLGEPGPPLDAADDEVPRLDEPGRAAVAPGQRLSRRRVVAEEGWLQEVLISHVHATPALTLH